MYMQLTIYSIKVNLIRLITVLSGDGDGEEDEDGYDDDY